MSRTLLVVIVLLAVFLPFNILSIRQLVRIHPRLRRWVLAVAVLCNLMWLFLPMLNARTDRSRLIRAILGPLWFAWLVFTILYSLFLFLLLLVYAGWRLASRSSHEGFPVFARIPSRVFLLLLTIGALIGWYQAVVPLRVEQVAITLAGLSPELRGTKLVVMADLHTGLFTRPSRLAYLFAAAAAERPAAILLAGDLVDDDPHYVPKLLAGADAAGSQVPILAVLGNHEMYGAPFEVVSRMRGSRIRLLVNEGLPLAPKLWIAGISDYAAPVHDSRLVPNMGAALAAMPEGSVPIVLAHQPKSFEEARRRRIPLTICGHTHGGQFGYRPAHWTLAGLFLPYDMGLYDRGGSQLYVNTGTGYWLLPFRLGMTPELTVIELR
ncbi:MAG: metallophosphoesterase [Acidobacteria bacterium]|nr:metallophosphoesterase [Acidobacteriota bacterium]